MQLLTNSIEKYLSDESNLLGTAKEVYIPETVEELRIYVLNCYRDNIFMTVRGGGTGLTGAAAPLSGSVISLEKMNKILDLDLEHETVTVEPCVSLQQLSEYLEKYNYFYPPNPTEITSTIGGNVATNASGSRTFKYGATRNSVNKLTVILSNGDVIKLERGVNFSSNGILKLKTTDNKIIEIPVSDIFNINIKNASGYYIRRDMDAIDLFIGSEGTLGIFTDIELKIRKKPESLLGLIVWFEEYNNLYKFFDEVKNISKISFKTNNLQEISARSIEFYNTTSLDFLRSEYSQIPQAAKYAIWIEQELENNEDVLLEKYLNLITLNSSLVDETWVALNEEEHKRFMEIRHTLPQKTTELVRNLKHTKLSLDMSVPEQQLTNYYQTLEEKFRDLSIPCCIYGHISSSHLHCDVFYSSVEEKTKAEKIYDKIISFGIDLGGVVSAEHGIGKLKRHLLYKMYPPEDISAMQNIKNILDHKNILNVGNIFK